jgi:hypothetical protein
MNLDIFEKYKAQMNIKKISRDGIVTIMILSVKGSSQLVGEFYNSSFAVELIS